MYFAERGRRPHCASIVRVGCSRDAFWLCLLKGGNPQPSPFTFSPFHPFTRSPIHPFTHSPLPAFCRFSLPFLLPLLNAASRRRLAKQNHCVVQYCRRRNCRCRAELGKFGFFCSLFTAHRSLRSGPPEKGRSHRLSVPGDRRHCRHAKALCGCDSKTRQGRDYSIRDQNLNRSGRNHPQVAGGGRTGTADRRFGRKGKTGGS